MPQALERLGARQLRVDDLGPAGGRARRDRPVRRPLVDDLDRLPQLRQQILAEHRGVDPIHDVRGDRAGERDQRTAVLAERAHPLPVPGRHEPERVGSGVQRSDALEMDVEHGQVDELGAGLVRRLRDRARERLLSGFGAEAHDLTGLDVGAEADDQLGQRVDPVGGPGTHDSRGGCHPFAVHASTTIRARTGMQRWRPVSVESNRWRERCATSTSSARPCSSRCASRSCLVRGRVGPIVYIDAIMSEMPPGAREAVVQSIDALADAALGGAQALAPHALTPAFQLIRALAIEAFYSDFVAPGAHGPSAYEEIDFHSPLAMRIKKDWSYLGVGRYERSLRSRRRRLGRRRRRRRRRARRAWPLGAAARGRRTLRGGRLRALGEPGGARLLVAAELRVPGRRPRPRPGRDDQRALRRGQHDDQHQGRAARDAARARQVARRHRPSQRPRRADLVRRSRPLLRPRRALISASATAPPTGTSNGACRPPSAASRPSARRSSRSAPTSTRTASSAARACRAARRTPASRR